MHGPEHTRNSLNRTFANFEVREVRFLVSVGIEVGVEANAVRASRKNLVGKHVHIDEGGVYGIAIEQFVCNCFCNWVIGHARGVRVSNCERVLPASAVLVLPFNFWIAAVVLNGNTRSVIAPTPVWLNVGFEKTNALVGASVALADVNFIVHKRVNNYNSRLAVDVVVRADGVRRIGRVAGEPHAGSVKAKRYVRIWERIEPSRLCLQIARNTHAISSVCGNLPKHRRFDCDGQYEIFVAGTVGCDPQIQETLRIRRRTVAIKIRHVYIAVFGNGHDVRI